MGSESKTKVAAFHIRRALIALGHDTNREGLADTPDRFAKFLWEFTKPVKFKATTFKSEGSGMIVVDNIPVVSLCEHHLAPFVGHATVGYLPGERMLGLSKLAWIVRKFAMRLQNQERITRQVAEHINEVAFPLGVGVVIRAQHSCMSMRGVKAHGAWTTTCELTGLFKKDGTTRSEFMGVHTSSIRH